jgi:hypothetical protein
MQDNLAAYDEAAVMEGGSARHAADKRLMVSFYKRAVKNQIKSDTEGRPIYDEKTYVRIIVPGDKHSIVDTPATREHTELRFPEIYARYIRNEAEVVSGTPLSVWPQMTISQVAELNGLNIYTVEQLADLADNLAQQFLGFNSLRQKAKNFLAASQGEAVHAKLQAELEKRDNEIEVMKRQMAEMSAAIAAMPKVAAGDPIPAKSKV